MQQNVEKGKNMIISFVFKTETARENHTKYTAEELRQRKNKEGSLGI